MGGYIGSRPVVVQVDGYQREESESRYVNATGDDFSGHLDFVDDAKARFGDSDELQIWTQSDGDGNSYLDGDKIIIRSAAGVARLSITSNDVDITSGALKVGGSTVISSSRNMSNIGTFSSTGQLQVTNGSVTLTGGYNVQWGTGYANGDPAIWGNTAASALRFAPTGSTDGIVVEIDNTGLDVAVGGLSVGGTTVISSNREITAKKLTLTDDGSSSPTLQVRTDDDVPWALVVGNDSVSTNALGGLNVYQNTTSGNVEMWTRTPDRSGGFVFRTMGITSNTSSDELLSLPAGVNDTALFYRRPKINHSAPYIILNDTDATDTSGMVGWLSFQRTGSERGFVGYGSASNDQLYVQNYDGNVVLSAGSNDAVNIASGNLQIGGNNVLYSNGDINGFGHLQTGTVSTDGAVIKNHHIRSSFESGTVVHPFWQNDWANFRKRGGTVTWGGLTGTPSNDNTDLMFTTSTYCQVYGGDYSGSTMTITLTTPPKNFTYGSWAGITFNNESWSPSSCKIETSTDGGSTWTTRLNATNASVQYLTSFSSGSTQTNAIRFTLGLPSQNGVTGSLRIQNIFAFGYNSSGMEQYFLPRGGGQVYGNVSINTSTTSTEPLYVAKDDGSGGIVIHNDGNDAYLKLSTSRNNKVWYLSHDGNNNSGSDNSLSFVEDGTTHRLTLKPGGSVGVNNSNPSSTLTIGGDGKMFLDSDSGNTAAIQIGASADYPNEAAEAQLHLAGDTNTGWNVASSRKIFLSDYDNDSSSAGVVLFEAETENQQTDVKITGRYGSTLSNAYFGGTLSVQFGSSLTGYFYEGTANQNGSGKPTSVLGVAAYTDNAGEGPSIDFSSVWTGSNVYQQDNWNEGWVVGRIAGVYDTQVSNGGALAFYTHTGTSATGGAGNTQVAERFRIKPEGQLTVSGTTPIATQEGVLRSGNIVTGSAGTSQTTPTMHGFAQIFIRDWASGRYVHMKTDIPTGTANHTFGMYAVKVVGYIYGNARTIDGIWAGHNWNSNVYSKAHTNNGGQAFVYNQYVSSDGYIVLVGDVGGASNSMYAGWAMDFHYTNTDYAAHTGTAYDAHTISAYSISTSTSGVY